MKTVPLLLASSLLWLTPAYVTAAEKTAPRYQALANELAAAFLRSPAHAASDLPAFLTKEEATAAVLKTAVEQAVAVGRALIADGVPADGKHFARLLADSTGVAAPAPMGGGTNPEKAVGSQSAVPSATEIASAKESLWRAGIDKLVGLPKAQRSLFTSINKIDPATLDAVFQDSAVPATLRDSDKFLIRVGYEQKAAAAKAAGTEVSAAQKAAAKEGVAAIKTPAALQTEAWFRDNGVSFATGFGIAHYGGEDRPVGSVLARWNLWQRVATAKWNQRIGENNSEGYALVPYWGKVEFYDRSHGKWGPSGLANAVAPTSGDTSVLPPISFLGLFVGSAAAGEQVTTRGDKERPYLVGASIGFGFYKEAAPFITFDVGKTVSPKHGFGSASNYYGFSVDAIVLGSITGFVRKPAAATSAAATP